MNLGTGAQKLYFVIIVWLIAGVAGVGLLASRRSAASRAEVASRANARKAGPRVLVTSATECLAVPARPQPVRGQSASTLEARSPAP